MEGVRKIIKIHGDQSNQTRNAFAKLNAEDGGAAVMIIYHTHKQKCSPSAVEGNTYLKVPESNTIVIEELPEFKVFKDALNYTPDPDALKHVLRLMHTHELNVPFPQIIDIIIFMVVLKIRPDVVCYKTVESEAEGEEIVTQLFWEAVTEFIIKEMNTESKAINLMNAFFVTKLVLKNLNYDDLLTSVDTKFRTLLEDQMYFPIKNFIQENSSEPISEFQYQALYGPLMEVYKGDDNYIIELDDVLLFIQRRYRKGPDQEVCLSEIEEIKKLPFRKCPPKQLERLIAIENRDLYDFQTRYLKFIQEKIEEEVKNYSS